MDAMTAASIAVLNQSRKIGGVAGNLQLVAAGATGYASVATISAGWGIARRRVPETGTQLLCCSIAEVEGIDKAIFPRSSAVIVEGLRYKIIAIEAPISAPRIWELICEPTGEKVA